MCTIPVMLLDKFLIQCYHKIEKKKMPPTLIKQSPKLYLAEYLDPLGIV